MQTKIYEKLTPELRDIANFFHKETTKYYYKRAYKDWQRLLNTYIDTYDNFANQYVANKKSKPLIRQLLITRFTDFEISSPAMVRMHNKDKPSSKALKTIYTNLPAYLQDNLITHIYKEITGNTMTTKPKTTTKPTKTFGTSKSTAAKLKPRTVKAKPVKAKPAQLTTTLGSMLEDSIKKTVSKPASIKLKHDVAVKLTVGGKSIDLAPLLSIPEVKDYLEQQQKTVLKAKNAQRATELANEIKNLGFDVEFS